MSATDTKPKPSRQAEPLPSTPSATAKRKKAPLPSIKLSAQSKKRLSLIDLNRQLTPTMIKALAYLGRHKKTDVIPSRVSCPITVRTSNALKKLGYVMDIGKSAIIPTFKGERAISAIFDTKPPT